jgi:hypothetical protein
MLDFLLTIVFAVGVVFLIILPATALLLLVALWIGVKLGLLK